MPPILTPSHPLSFIEHSSTSFHAKPTPLQLERLPAQFSSGGCDQGLEGWKPTQPASGRP